MATLLWFQRDLRLTDNPALNHAIGQNQPVIAIYVHSADEDQHWAAGAASRWWLHHSLEKLEHDLQKLGITLQFFKADSVSLIPRLAKEYAVENIVWTNRHEPHRRDYEAIIEKKLFSDGKSVHRFTGELLTHPDNFVTQTKQTPYKVFTPFYKKLRQQLNLAQSIHNPVPAAAAVYSLPFKNDSALTLQQLGLLGSHPWHEKLHQHWIPGEKEALAKLKSFMAGTITGYVAGRDYPAIDATSGLSPHLHFGEISPRQIVNALAPLIDFHGGNHAIQAEAFLRQLIWREFARYILWHFPQTTTEPMNAKFTSQFWKKDEVNLIRWQQGKTGIPIIDAGMKQLWQTGAMHNRVRMLVASFLTKNLGVAWQQGASWFWDPLVDADLANNSMGWQWVAGCGVDAAPYFRIFNPETQAKRFDGKSIYINQWLPEHSQATCPAPFIDLARSRNDSLQRYKQYINTKVK